MVKVSTCAYDKLFKRYTNIVVPEYQRPFRWDDEKVEELLTDFEEFFIKDPKLGLEYYMGSILFYDNKKKKTLEIIDGQQRLTTLLLIQYCLNGELTDGQNLTYNSHISFYNIQKVKQFLEAKMSLLDDLNDLKFLKNIRLTVIISKNEDNAFAFFDSQNNRGVSLGADDYLKAYHLRSVKSENLQATLAQEWEQVTFDSQKEKNTEAGLLHLFYKILYRSRQWRGQSELIPEQKEQILKAFQKQTYKPRGDTYYDLFSGRNNQKYDGVILNGQDKIEYQPTTNVSQENTKLPFTIRQPLYKGLNFFQFTQKYHSIHQHIFSYNGNVTDSIVAVRKYYNSIYPINMSIFLRHYMQLCLVMFYDVFGENEIDIAIKYFDYFIGSIRIEKYYVRRQAVRNSLKKEYSNNLLDVIAHAYLPEEIFNFISDQPKVKSIYENEKLDNDGGVRSNYKNRVLAFFNKDDVTLRNRLLWIK